MKKDITNTQNAPQAIGCYSQAVKVGDTIYLSGQIGLDPDTMQLHEGFTTQTHQVFKNLQAVCIASGGSLANIVKLNLYVTDLANFTELNQIMAEYFAEPYPARAAIGVNQLPKNSLIEADCVMVI